MRGGVGTLVLGWGGGKSEEVWNEEDVTGRVGRGGPEDCPCVVSAGPPSMGTEGTEKPEKLTGCTPAE